MTLLIFPILVLVACLIVERREARELAKWEGAGVELLGEVYDGATLRRAAKLRTRAEDDPRKVVKLAQGPNRHARRAAAVDMRDNVRRIRSGRVEGKRNLRMVGGGDK